MNDVKRFFDDTLRKFERHSKLFEKCDLNHEEESEYNLIVDSSDAIYADVLKYGKIIGKNPEEYRTTKEKLLTFVYNAGILKSDIDDEKEFDDLDTSGKVEPMLDDKEIEKYLFES